MDQPTRIEMKIKGNALEVKRAANAAERRIDLYTSGFEAQTYAFGDGSDFEKRMDGIFGLFGSYTLKELENGDAEWDSEQESYGCISEEDIREIAEEMIQAAPEVVFHISAVITVTESEGYEICVELDYLDGQLQADIFEDYFDEDEADL